MKKAGIRKDQLPESSVIYGMPEAFWKEYPVETGLTVAVVLLLAAGLVITFRLLGQRASLLNGIRELNADLEERVRQRTEALRQAETTLIRSEKLATLGSLVAGIAHEVNTPLGTALTASSYLKDQFKRFVASSPGAVADGSGLAESSLEIAGIIERNIKRAATQISAFRQVAVDQTGEEPCRFFMSSLIEQCLLSMKNELKKAGVGVKVDCDEEIVFTHFPGDIWRILANLLMNSLKHAYPDGRAGTVFLRVRLLGGIMEILYSDDCVGVPAASTAQLFDPFYSTVRESGGIGAREVLW